MNRKFAKYSCENCGGKKHAKKDVCACEKGKPAAPKKRKVLNPDAE